MNLRLRKRFQMASTAACLASLALLCPPAQAGTVCDSKDAMKYLPPLPRGCQWQRIEAAGGLSFGIVRSAGTNARKAWQRQVITFFGERYSDWDMAACKKVLCVEASVSGSRRCTYSAFPCASDAEPAAIEALNTQQIAPVEQPTERELTAAEVREMQELLSRAGYRVGTDGFFGEGTQRALASWQHRKGLPDNGNASLASLEDLRRLSAPAGSRGR